MSLLDWFAPKKKQKREAPPAATPSSDLSRLDSTRTNGQARGAGAASSSARKQDRSERRELLYAVVREAMVRAGVLSSSYKFKVLSLDSRGRQFVVMVDLVEGAASSTARLAEIEAMIAQSAKARYDIVVGAVYWRANEHIAIGDPAHFTAHKPLISQPAALVSRPAPLAPEISRPAELSGTQTGPRTPHYEPLQADEVDAFRKALDAGVRGERALAAAQEDKTHGQSYTLLTGFEDTEMVEGDASQQLSGTQWGALR